MSVDVPGCRARIGHVRDVRGNIPFDKLVWTLLLVACTASQGFCSEPVDYPISLQKSSLEHMVAQQLGQLTYQVLPIPSVGISCLRSRYLSRRALDTQGQLKQEALRSLNLV